MPGPFRKEKLTSLFFIAIFTSLAIPRCGFYWQKIPVSLANLLLGIVFLVWIIRVFSPGMVNSIRPMVHYGGAAGKAAIGFIIYSLVWMIGGFFKREIFGAMVNFAVIAGGVLFFLITIDLFKEQRDVWKFCNLVCLTLFIVCIYGILQVFVNIESISIPGVTELYGSPEEAELTLVHNNPQITAGPAWQKNNMWSWETTPPIFIGTKIFSTFHHGNIFGSHLAAFLPLAIAMSMAIKKRALSNLCFLVSILGSINILFTNSRGALLGLLVGLVIMIVLTRKSFFIIISVGLIVILLFLGILAWAISHEHKITGVEPSTYLSYYEDRYIDLARLIFFPSLVTEENYTIDELSNKRVSTFKIALETIFHPPSITAGLFGRSFKLESDQILHNFFITLIYKMGWIGFSLFLSFLVILFRTILKSVSSAALTGHIIAMGGLAGLIGGLVHNLVDSPFYYPPLAVNFWILTGAIIANIRQNIK